MTIPKYFGLKNWITIAPIIGLTILVRLSTELNIPSVPPNLSFETNFVERDVIETPINAEEIDNGVRTNSNIVTLFEKEYKTNNITATGIRYFTTTYSANFLVIFPTKKT